MNKTIFRGDLYWANLPKQPNSSVIFGCRPVVIISNDKCNANSPVVTVVPLTSQNKKGLPTHVEIIGYGLEKSSIVLTEQVISIDKRYLNGYISSIKETQFMEQIENCLALQFAG